MAPVPISGDEKRQALDRVLESRTLGRSDQLRSFLRYVCEAEFEGRAQQLNEYALSVLGRPADSAPQVAQATEPEVSRKTEAPAEVPPPARSAILPRLSFVLLLVAVGLLSASLYLFSLSRGDPPVCWTSFLCCD